MAGRGKGPHPGTGTTALMVDTHSVAVRLAAQPVTAVGMARACQTAWFMSERRQLRAERQEPAAPQSGPDAADQASRLNLRSFPASLEEPGPPRC